MKFEILLSYFHLTKTNGNGGYGQIEISEAFFIKPMSKGTIQEKGMQTKYLYFQFW